MKISAVKDYAAALELRKEEPAGGSQNAVICAPAEETTETGEPDQAIKSATEPAAVPPLMDFQLSGVRNDFSSKYRRAELALEGTIYRLTQTQSALLNSSEEPGELVALPGNSNLQQTADHLAALAHAESVKFKKGN